MKTVKCALIVGTILSGFSLGLAPPADAGVFVRRAPVRRVAARAALPPYPVARRVAYRPVVGPVVRPVVRPVGVWGAPVMYGPGVSVVVGF